MLDDYGYDEEPEDYQQPEPDEYFLEAQKDIKSLYEDDRDGVFYIRQLQVKFEEKYFHWVTNNAVMGLLKTGYLRDLRIPRETGTGK